MKRQGQIINAKDRQFGRKVAAWMLASDHRAANNQYENIFKEIRDNADYAEWFGAELRQATGGWDWVTKSKCMYLANRVFMEITRKFEHKWAAREAAADARLVARMVAADTDMEYRLNGGAV